MLFGTLAFHQGRNHRPCATGFKYLGIPKYLVKLSMRKALGKRAFVMVEFTRLSRYYHKTLISTTPNTRHISVLERSLEPFKNTVWLRVPAGGRSANLRSCRKGVVAWPIRWDASNSNHTEANRVISIPALLSSN